MRELNRYEFQVNHDSHVVDVIKAINRLLINELGMILESKECDDCLIYELKRLDDE